MKYIYSLIVFILLFSACGKSDTEKEVENQPVADSMITISQQQFEGEDMQIGMLKKSSFDQIVKVNGMTDVPPNNKASINTFMGGYIKHTPLLIGDRVKKGQLLVTLENTDYVEIQQEYLEVAEQLRYLKSEYERQETLFNEKITSEKNFLRAESSYKSTLAMYNGLRQKLRMMHIDPAGVEKGSIRSTISIYAPISGNVTRVNVSNGSFVSPSDEIMEIINTDHIHLELTVFEKDILQVKKGQKIRFTIPEASDSTFIAEVHLVGTSIDPVDRTVKVHGHIEDDEHLQFVTGMFVEAAIIKESKEGYGLPKDAVIEIDDSHFILELEAQQEGTYTFRKQKVILGDEGEDTYEIVNFKDVEGKKILTKGAFMALTE